MKATVLYICTIFYLLPSYGQSLPKIEAQIIGEWQWVNTSIKSFGGFSNVITPEDCNCTKKLTISASSFYQNNQQESTQKYKLTEHHNGDGSKQQLFISKELQGEISIHNDSLFIGALSSLGELHTYKKSVPLPTKQIISPMKKIDIQGHRGCRGLMPENSIEGFKKAIDLGVHTLEMDVVVSKDNQVVVSHEVFFNEEICTDVSIRNIYQTPYDQIKSIDCGSKPHKRFPNQQKLKTYKPLLKDVITEMTKYTKAKGLPPIKYNIELKSKKEGYGIYYPNPEEFVTLVTSIIRENNLENATTLQSFDVNILNILHDKAPNITTAYLVENNQDFKQAFTLIHFKPSIYSPDFKLINQDLLMYLKQQNIKLIPWTVNEVSDMKKLIQWNVDGIITDYPNRLIPLLK